MYNRCYQRFPPTRGALFGWTFEAFCFGTGFACKQKSNNGVFLRCYWETCNVKHGFTQLNTTPVLRKICWYLWLFKFPGPEGGKKTKESCQERMSVQFGEEKPVYYLPTIPSMDIMHRIFIIWYCKSIKLVYVGPLLSTCLQHHNLKILCTMSCTKPRPKSFTYMKTFILQSFEK